MKREEVLRLRRGDSIFKVEEVEYGGEEIRVFEWVFAQDKVTDVQAGYRSPATVMIRRAMFRGARQDGGQVKRCSVSDLAAFALTAKGALELFVRRKHGSVRFAEEALQHALEVAERAVASVEKYDGKVF